MYCTACGSEIDPQGKCPRCLQFAGAASPSVPQGDAFFPPKIEKSPGNWQSPVLTVIAFFCFGVVFFLNYLKALHWAGVMNPEAAGYMIGGVMVSSVIGLVVMYLLGRKRTRKNHFGAKALLSAAIALAVTVFSFAGEMTRFRFSPDSDAKHKAGTLLKEAAGKLPASANVNWYDGPTRDFFHDILEMNQRYVAEAAAADNSAIKDLYSSKSYAGQVHMQKVVTQLRTALAIDEKYASLGPIIKKMEDRIAAANASESAKQEFLRGWHESFQKSLRPRNDVIEKEEAWMKCTIELYEFAIAHTGDYSIRDNKLYFRNNTARESFTAQQTKAVALRKEFLKAKSAMEDSRKSKLDQLGVSTSDLTPAQMGKQK